MDQPQTQNEEQKVVCSLCEKEGRKLTLKKLDIEHVRWHRFATEEGRAEKVHTYTTPGHIPCSSCGTEVTRFYRFLCWGFCDVCWQKIDPKLSRHDKLGEGKKAKHLAPAYACIYPILAERARPMGYAVGIHGSMANDLDVVCVPWTEDAVPAEELLEELVKGCSVFFVQDHNGDYVKEDGSFKNIFRLNDVMHRPHGRRTWAIQLGAGAYIDISVLPRMQDFQSLVNDSASIKGETSGN